MLVASQIVFIRDANVSCVLSVAISTGFNVEIVGTGLLIVGSTLGLVGYAKEGDTRTNF